MSTRPERLNRRGFQRKTTWLLLCVLPLAIACGSAAQRKQAFLEDGDRAAAAGKYADAIIDYRNAIQIDGNFAQAHLRLAEAYEKQGESLSALGSYVRAAELYPDNLDLQVRTGNLQMAIGKLSEAQARAKAVLQQDPNHVEAHILLGNTLGALVGLDQALEQMEEAIRINPSRDASYIQLGILQQARGDLPQAEKALLKAIELSPRSPGGHLALAHFYWTTGRMADADRKLTTALEIDPSSQAANRAKAVFAVASGKPLEAEPYLKRVAELAGTPASKFSLADYYLSLGRTADAIRILDPLAAAARTAPAAQPRLARAHAMAGDRSKAHAVVAELLARDPKDAEALMLESQLLLDEGKREDALARARAAVEADFTSAGAQFALGKAYAALGDIAGAEAAFRETLKINPRATPAQIELSLMKLGERGRDAVRLAESAVATAPQQLDTRIALVRSLLAAGDLARAEKEIATLIRQRPTAAVHVQSGVLAGLRNQMEQARAAFDKALSLEPRNLEAIAGHLSLDLRSGNVGAAKARLTRVLESGTPSPELLLLAARSLYAANELNDAETLLRRAIQAEPLHLAAYSLLGQLYVRQGKLDQARAEFDRLATKQSQPTGALTMAGMILQIQGNTAGARERFERAVSGDSNAAIAANNLAWIYAESGENLNRAITLAQSALERLPELPEALDTLGWAYYKSDAPAMAVSPLQRCARIAPPIAMCHYHLGLVYSKLGDDAGARRALETALRVEKKAAWLEDAREALAAVHARASK